MPHSYPDRANGQFPQASWFNGPQKDLKVLTAQVFNVREDTFAGGAKGDGSTDDSAAFQAAINAAIAARGTLFIPPAESGLYYNIASPLFIQPASGSQAYMNVEGHMSVTGDLHYSGPSNSSVFQIKGWKYSRVSGLHVHLNTQDNVRVFDVVQDATYNSHGVMKWDNCHVFVGAGQANVGWRWGADATNGDISLNAFVGCAVGGVTFAGTTDQQMDRGHVGWLNMNNNALANSWVNCGGGLMSHWYRGGSLLDHLNGAIDAVVTTITVDSTVGFAPTGRFRLDTEQIDYTGTTATTFTGCTRGAGGTTAASHITRTVVYQGVQNPLDSTWTFDRLGGGGGNTFTNCSGSFNRCDFLFRGGPSFIDGGRFEQSKRFVQWGYGGSVQIGGSVRGVTWSSTATPTNGVVIGIAHPGVYTISDCAFGGTDMTATFLTAGPFDTLGGPAGIGSVRLTNTSVRATVSPLWTVLSTWKFDASGSIRVNSSAQPTALLAGTGQISADNGDAAKTLVPKVDTELQRWNTALTAARAVTLNTTGASNGDHFRIVREAGATGAFNLNIGTGPLKALTAAGQFADVTFDGTAWRLTGNGAL
jgi:hypothetical protein